MFEKNLKVNYVKRVNNDSEFCYNSVTFIEWGFSICYALNTT